MARVTIFHTSDLHNRLTDQLAQRLRELKEEHPGSLMLDSGDAIRAGNILWWPGGEPILDRMSSVPYDAMCLGNREFHFLARGLFAKTAKAGFPILSANLKPAKSGLETPAASSLVLDSQGLRVGVFGLSVPCITLGMLVGKLSHYYFETFVEAAARVVAELRDRCDVIVALTHIGVEGDRKLAREVQGIDLILGGHTHMTTEERVLDTAILHHGSHAHWLGKATVEREPGRQEPGWLCQVMVHELIPLGKA